MSEDEVNQFEKRWNEISEQALDPLFLASKRREKIFFDKNKFTRLYTIAYDISNSKSSNIQIKCYDRICSLVTIYCQEISNNITTIQQKNINLVLEEFVKEWMIYKENVLHWIFKIFSYILKNHYKVRKQKNLDIELKSTFKTLVFQDRDELLEDLFIKMMNYERLGNEIDTEILRNYFDFLTMTENFSLEERNIFKIRNKILLFLCTNYSNNSTLQLNNTNNNYVNYLIWGNKAIENENKTLLKYLPGEITTNLVSEIKKIIFYDRSSELMDASNGIFDLLENFNIENLKLSYQTFKENKDGLQYLLDIFKKFSKSKVENVFAKIDASIPDSDIPIDIANKTDYVEEIFTVFEKISGLISDSFEGNNTFSSVLKEVFSDAQSRNHKFNCSYILPFAIDFLIKKISSQPSSKEFFLKYTDRLIFFFPTLPEKDAFIDVHKNLLCERILTESWINLEFEEYMMEKLKIICGLNYVNFIEGIVSDYKTQNTMNQNYRDWLNNPSEAIEDKNKIVTSFQILDANFWPKYPLKEVLLPTKLLINSDVFNKFYKSSNEGKGRCFKWIHNYSIVEIESSLFKLTRGKINNKESLTLIVNNFQAAILDLFSKKKNDSLHLFEISSILNIEGDDLKENILPLLIGNESNILEKVIKLIGTEDSVLISDAVQLNTNFSCTEKTINYANIRKNEGFIRKEKIFGERSSAIEANIVKIMKHHKTLNHHDLVEKVLKALEMFKINISAIKKKIDNLIERDIIRRDKDNPHVYNYFNDSDS